MSVEHPRWTLQQIEDRVGVPGTPAYSHSVGDSRRVPPWPHLWSTWCLVVEVDHEYPGRVGIDSALLDLPEVLFERLREVNQDAEAVVCFSIWQDLPTDGSEYTLGIYLGRESLRRLVRAGASIVIDQIPGD